MGADAIDGTQFRWQSMALCNGLPSYIFFPDEQVQIGFEPDPEFEGVTYETFCGLCPVKNVCLEFALLHDSQGIWGGQTDRQRQSKYCAGERRELREYKEDVGKYTPLYGHS